MNLQDGGSNHVVSFALKHAGVKITVVVLIGPVKELIDLGDLAR